MSENSESYLFRQLCFGLYPGLCIAHIQVQLLELPTKLNFRPDVRPDVRLRPPPAYPCARSVTPAGVVKSRVSFLLHLF